MSKLPTPPRPRRQPPRPPRRKALAAKPLLRRAAPPPPKRSARPVAMAKAPAKSVAPVAKADLSFDAKATLLKARATKVCAQSEIRPGDIIASRYRVSAIMSRSRGLLLDAIHTGFEKRVVIRVLSPSMVDSKAVDRFNREARLLSQLESEHVGRILDYGSLSDGSLYLVREYIEGISLAAHIAERGGLTLQHATRITLQIAEALAEAHSRGVVLRDLQATHVFLCKRRNGTMAAKITDFGTCKVVRDASAGGELSCTKLMGLSSSAAPELVRQSADIDARADVWSLGCLFYQMLTHRAPFQGEGVALMLTITRDQPPTPCSLRPELPDPVDQVVAWALSKDRERRFASIYGFAHQLRSFADAHGAMLIDQIARLACGDAASEFTTPRTPPIDSRSAAAPVSAVPAQAAAVEAADEDDDASTVIRKVDPLVLAARARAQVQAAQAAHAALQPIPVPVVVAAASIPMAAAARDSYPSVPAAPAGVDAWVADALAREELGAARRPWRKALWALPAAAVVLLAVFLALPSASGTAATSLASAGADASQLAERAGASMVAAAADAEDGDDHEDSRADEAIAKDEAKAKSDAARAKKNKARHARKPARRRRAKSQFLRPQTETKRSPKGRTGTLVAMAVGASCAFSVDGTPRGVSSSVRVTVPAGTHAVTCARVGGSSRTRSVNVTAGKASVAVFKF